jgi:hypothetical protein
MIKYILWSIYETIIKNPVKIVCIILIPFSLIFNDFSKSEEIFKLIDTIKVENQNLYVVEKIEDSLKKYEIIQSESKLEIRDNNIIFYDTNPFTVVFWIIFGISILIVVVGSIAGWIGEDGWDLSDVHDKSFSELISCELEDNIYYYVALGRLVGKSTTQKKRDRVLGDFGVYGFSDLRLCPKWESKINKRDNKLSKLGI